MSPVAKPATLINRDTVKYVKNLYQNATECMHAWDTNAKPTYY